MTLIKIISDPSCSSVPCVYIACDSIQNHFSLLRMLFFWFYLSFSLMLPILVLFFSLSHPFPLSLCACTSIAFNSTALQCGRYTDVYRFMYDQLDEIESDKKHDAWMGSKSKIVFQNSVKKTFFMDEIESFNQFVCCAFYLPFWANNIDSKKKNCA